MNRQERISLHKKQERIQTETGSPSVNDLTEGVPVFRVTTEGVVQYIRYNNALYKKVFDKA